jgi:hypothetical protein
MALARTRADMSAQPSKRDEAALPRSDAPEHPIDPADAVFLDPDALAHAPEPVPSAQGGDVPDTPGYGDFEGERAPGGDGTDEDTTDAKPRR